MSFYKVLNKQVFSLGEYSLVPIRMEDRYDIMQWRNEQMYHLRQAEPLTKAKQDDYFENVVTKLFDQEQPNQLLFSFLKGEECIGYGGLVHINWIDKNAEISFIMETELEEQSFEKNWGLFLDLIEQVAFSELNFHKIFTYAFDIRTELYKPIEEKGFRKEAILKEHCLFNGKYMDVVIHSKINSNLKLRKLNNSDKKTTFNWANDSLTRKNSFYSKEIKDSDHSIWFDKKLDDENAYYLIGEIKNERIGLVRFDYDVSIEAYVIGITIDKKFRGKKLSSSFLEKACEKFLETKDSKIIALIKKTNASSIKAFERAGFNLVQKKYKENNDTLKYYYEK
jgi:RimJ/RimL family protein N-acetyltransferase